MFDEFVTVVIMDHFNWVGDMQVFLTLFSSLPPLLLLLLPPSHPFSLLLPPSHPPSLLLLPLTLLPSSSSLSPSRFARGIESVETASSMIGPQNNQYIPQFQSGPPMPLQLTTYNPPAPAYNAPAYINPPPFAEALKHRTHPPSASIHPEIPGTVQPPILLHLYTQYIGSNLPA